MHTVMALLLRGRPLLDVLWRRRCKSCWPSRAAGAACLLVSRRLPLAYTGT